MRPLNLYKNAKIKIERTDLVFQYFWFPNAFHTFQFIKSPFYRVLYLQKQDKMRERKRFDELLPWNNGSIC